MLWFKRFPYRRSAEKVSNSAVPQRYVIMIMRHMSHKKSRSSYPKVSYGDLVEILPVMMGKRRDRFKAKIALPDHRGCRIWLGGSTKEGYGLVQGSIDYQGFSFLTHRVAWALANAAEPGEQIVRHTCDNPPCCADEHLVAGTQAENMRDMYDRGRARSGAKGKLGPDANAADFTAAQRQRAITMRYRLPRRRMADIAAVIGCSRSTLYLWFAEYEAAVVAGKIHPG